MRLREPEVLIDAAGNLREEIRGRCIAPAVAVVDARSNSRGIDRHSLDNGSHVLKSINSVSWVLGKLGIARRHSHRTGSVSSKRGHTLGDEINPLLCVFSER